MLKCSEFYTVDGEVTVSKLYKAATLGCIQTKSGLAAISTGVTQRYEGHNLGASLFGELVNELSLDGTRFLAQE